MLFGVESRKKRLKKNQKTEVGEKSEEHIFTEAKLAEGRKLN